MKKLLSRLLFAPIILIGTLFLSSCNASAFQPQSDSSDSTNNISSEPQFLIRWLDPSNEVLHSVKVYEGTDLTSEMDVATKLIKKVDYSTNNVTKVFSRWDDDTNVIADRTKDYTPIFIDYQREECTYGDFREVTNSITGLTEKVCTLQKYNRTDKNDIVIPDVVVYNGDVYNVVEVAPRAFRSAPSLTTLFIGCNVQTIGESAFENCGSLATVYTLYSSITKSSSGIVSYLTEIGKNAFKNCPNLIYFVSHNGERSTNTSGTVRLENNITTIGDYAFSGCSGITQAHFGLNVADIGEGVFDNCSNLIGLSVDDNNPNYLSKTFSGTTKSRQNLNMIIRKQTEDRNAYVAIGCKRSKFYNLVETMPLSTAVSTVNPSDTTYSTSSITVEVLYEVEIPDYAFYNIIFDYVSTDKSNYGEAVPITSLTIPSCFVSVGNMAFGYDRILSSLQTVTFEGYLSNLSSSAFEGCPDLTTVDVLKKVAFSQYSYFVKRKGALVDASSEITPYRTTPKGAVVQEIYDEEDSSIVTDIVLTIGTVGSADFESSDTVQITKIAPRAYFKRNITSFTISSSSLYEIGEYAFAYCTKLTRLVYLNPQHSDFLEIPKGCFQGCSGLTKVTLPRGITKIGDYAFSQCLNCTEFVLGSNINQIRDYAFQSCTGLSLSTGYVNYRGTSTQWKTLIERIESGNFLGNEDLINARVRNYNYTGE